MRKLILLFVLATLAVGAQAQQKELTDRQWMKRGEWAGGFTKAKAHKSLNVAEFRRQYEKNPEQWQALFRWLQETDLAALPKGKHPIAGSALVASVEDAKNEPLEKRNTESHRRKADFMVVVRGTEGFALLDHATSTVSKPYDEKKDVVRYHYQKDKTRFFDVKAGRFVIFFPDDWHIAKVETRKKDQTLRVIVVKMDYAE